MAKFIDDLPSLVPIVFCDFALVKKVKVVILPVMAAALQAVLISFFHQSLAQIVWVSVFAVGLLFISLLLYLFKNTMSYARGSL